MRQNECMRKTQRRYPRQALNYEQTLEALRKGASIYIQEGNRPLLIQPDQSGRPVHQFAFQKLVKAGLLRRNPANGNEPERVAVEIWSLNQ